MASVNNNPLLQGVRGRVGDFIVKQYSYGTVITAAPVMPRRKLTALQKLKRKNFAEAVAYAQGILRNPAKKAAYARKLPKGKRVYHAAIQEFMAKKRKEVAGK